MVDLDEFSRVVAAIYAAVLRPGDWTVPLDGIRRAAGASATGLLVGDSHDRTILSASLPDEARNTYLAYFHTIDYVLDKVEQSPIGLIHAGSDLIARQPRSEFNHDWMRPHGLQDGLFVRLTPGPHPTCFIIAAPCRDDPFATRERVEFVNALVPHWQQALRAVDYLAGLNAAATEVVEVIETMRNAVIVIDAHHAVVHRNIAAAHLLGANDGLCIRDGGIHARAPKTDAELQSGIGQALTHQGRGATMTCDRAEGKRPYIVHILPLGLPDPAARGQALLIVINPDDLPSPPTTLVRKVFGMTPAEAEVAVRLTNGDGIKPISEELHLSTATIKTHLQHVFDKTRTHRQTELIRLLLAVLP